MSSTATLHHLAILVASPLDGETDHDKGTKKASSRIEVFSSSLFLGIEGLDATERHPKSLLRL